MNPVGWFEIYVNDIARAQKFYETVLGTKLADLPAPNGDLQMRSFPMERNGSGCTGALAQMEGVKAGGNSTVVYFVCDNCATEAGRVKAAGGSVFKEKFAIGQYGFIALAIDTEGNMFGLHSMK